MNTTGDGEGNAMKRQIISLLLGAALAVAGCVHVEHHKERGAASASNAAWCERHPGACDSWCRDHPDQCGSSTAPWCDAHPEDCDRWCTAHPESCSSSRY